jgi:putative transposase
MVLEHAADHASQWAASTYHAHAAKSADPGKRSARARRDAALQADIRRVWNTNFQVYGVRKVWRQLQRKAITAPRCQVARLMKRMGLAGAVSGKTVKTTHSDKSAPSPLDRVNRQFRAPGPNVLWVSDLTYVATWKGFVYVAFVIDAFARRIADWRVSRSTREQTLCDRRPVRQGGLAHHSDRGVHQSFAHPTQQIELEESIEAVRLGEQRRGRVEDHLRAQIPAWSLFPLVQNLSVLRGLNAIASAGLAAAIGDPSRFASAPDFMADVGLVPSEHSTGRKRRVGAIIKAGDVHARTLLIAAAHSYRFPPLIARQKLTAVDAVPQSFTRQTAPQLRRSCRRTAWPLACAATICCPRPATTNFPSAKVYPKLAITPRSSGRLICITSADCSPPLAPGSHQPHNPSHAHL